MSTTERDATKRWCPFVRGAWARLVEGERQWQTTSDPVGFNRALIPSERMDLPVGRCLGSQCMAWRTSGSERVGREVTLIGLERKQVTVVLERRGYCGLAGAPGLTDEEVLHER